MINLIELSEKARHPDLAKLITAYNQTAEGQNQEIGQIFILQKINHYLETCNQDREILTWRSKSGPNSLEMQMQRFGIIRDGSTLVKNIQFASAVHKYRSSTSNSLTTTPPNLDYFSALQARNALLERPFDTLNDEDKHQYIQCNNVIIQTYMSSPDLQEQYNRSQYFLSLCYAKMEAIQGVVEQEFGEFETKQLGERQGNNRNFTLNIAGEDQQLVLRVEDRNSLVTEQVLQTYPVSQYFSEDYYTIMLPFKEGLLVNYRPVVLSEYVEEGSLEQYANSLQEVSPSDLKQATQSVFWQLSDFCIQLMETGHYHPDIKLSNFLGNGQQIKVSDRKTIINKAHPNGMDISSTAIYAPPEYRSCFNKTMTGINRFQAMKVTLDMPLFMSYQLGMALKEFMVHSMEIPILNPEVFLNWVPITSILKAPSRTQKNLYALVQEMTRETPQDRLSIPNFQILLDKIHLPHKAFLAEIALASPQEQLSNHRDLELLQNMIQTPKFTTEMQQAWHELEQNERIIDVISDPRTRFFEYAQKEIQTYLAKIDTLIAAENRKKTTSLKRVGSFIGLVSPENTTIETLPAIPIMPEKIKWYYDILQAFSSPMIDATDMAKLEQIHLREKRVEQLQSFSPARNSPDTSLTTSPADSLYENRFPQNLEDSRDDLDPFLDSGTFIQRPLPDHQNTSPQSTETDFSFDSRSMIQHPVAAEDPEFNAGSLIINAPAINDANVKKNQSNLKKALKRMVEEENAATPLNDDEMMKVSDIDTTIQRGNKKNK